MPKKCLLYLLDRAEVHETDREAENLAQDRIAEALMSNVGHISRAMNRLNRRGYVKKGKVHVHGVARRRLAYFLTDEGLRKAKEVQRQLEESSVTVIDLEGNEKECRLYQVHSFLPHRPKFSDLILNVKDGRLDLREFLDKQRRLQAGKVYDVQEAIHVPHFQGREDMLRLLDSFLEDKRLKGFLLVGLPGIGKTAVASQWIAGLKGQLHVLWRRVHPNTRMNDVLRDLASLLHSIGRPSLLNYLQRPPETGKDISFDLLKQGLSELRILLIFDDAHSVRDDIELLIKELLNIDSIQAHLKILLVSRERVTFIRAEDVARGKVRVEELDDLSQIDAKAMLESMGVDTKLHQTILERCGGHPLSLELAAEGTMPLESVRRTSISLLTQEAISRLSSSTRRKLEFAAVFEGSVPIDILGVHARELVQLCLLRELDNKRANLHDLVRETVIQGLTPERLSTLHKRAGDFQARSRNPDEVVNALRHYISGGAFRKCEALASERGQELIDYGLAESLLSILKQLSRASEIAPFSPRLLLLQGHTLFALGQWAEAARIYETCQEAKEPRIIAEALLGQGKAEVQRHSVLALPLLNKARENLERLGNLRLLAETEYWIGGSYEDAGNLDEARYAFERGRAISFTIGDRRWEGLCTYGIGRLQTLKKDYSAAIEHEEEALRLLEREGSRLEIAKVCTGIGGDLVELSKYQEAESYLNRAIDEARATGAMGILASSLYNLAGLQKATRGMNQAIPLLTESLKIFEQLEKYDEASWCASWLAYNEWTNGQEDKGNVFWKRAEQLLSKTLEPALRARALKNFARVKLRANRKVEAQQYLRQAIDEARVARLTNLEADLQTELNLIN